MNGLAFNRDGKLLAAVCDNGSLVVWDVVTWQRVAMQRADGQLNACVWLDYLSRPTIAAVGGRGTYLFGLIGN